MSYALRSLPSSKIAAQKIAEFAAEPYEHGQILCLLIIKIMESQSENPIADDETWKAILEPAICTNPAAAECLARLLFTLKKAIDSGPEGAIRASQTLLNAAESIYLYTDAHQAARKLYLLSLEGTLKPQDEPLNLINAALERGRRRAPITDVGVD